jgi:hypothetical protein
MVDLDQALIHRIGKLMRADNVHRLRTWLFLYEKSAPGSKDRLQYESLLREYVATQNAIVAPESCESWGGAYKGRRGK